MTSRVPRARSARPPRFEPPSLAVVPLALRHKRLVGADVLDQRLHLELRPAAPDRGHVALDVRGVLAARQDLGQLPFVDERRVACDRWADVAFSLEAVALCAGALP